MWPALAIVACGALIALHFYWRRREARVLRQLTELRSETRTMGEEHNRATTQERAQLQTLFNSMIEGVLVLDGTGRIGLVNHAIERLFGVTADLRGRTILEAFRLHGLQELVNQAMIEGQVLGHELELPVLEN